MTWARAAVYFVEPFVEKLVDKNALGNLASSDLVPGEL